MGYIRVFSFTLTSVTLHLFYIYLDLIHLPFFGVGQETSSPLKSASDDNKSRSAKKSSTFIKITESALNRLASAKDHYFSCHKYHRKSKTPYSFQKGVTSDEKSFPVSLASDPFVAKIFFWIKLTPSEEANYYCRFIIMTSDEMGHNNDPEKGSPIGHGRDSSDLQVLPPGTYSGKSSIWRRLSQWGVEVKGINPVPIEERIKTNYNSIFFMWVSIVCNLLP